MAKLKVEAGKIFFEEKNYECAIEELNEAIGTRFWMVEMLIEVGSKDKMELIELEELLGTYYDKNSQSDKVIETLLAKLELVEEVYTPEHKTALKLKRSLASVMIKNAKSKEAISVLEEILVFPSLLRKQRKRSMAPLRPTSAKPSKCWAWSTSPKTPLRPKST